MLLEYENFIKRINNIMVLIGGSLYRDDKPRNVIYLVKNKWIFILGHFIFNLAVICQIIWLILGLMNGESLLQITYLMPCLTLCCLGDFKFYSFLYYERNVTDLIDTLRKLLRTKKTDDMMINSWPTFLKHVQNFILILNFIGLAAFMLGPFIITATYYYTTGEILLFLPFLCWYPFDSFDIRYWPFVYIQQLSSAWIAMFSVYGPDSFFFTCCTYIHVQFLFLHRDMQQLVGKDLLRTKNNTSRFKTEFVEIVNQQRELIRCVKLLDTVYSKSTLFNVVTSSIIICAAGFNLVALKNYVLMVPFGCFLIYGTLQIFFYSYYGDYVMKSSMKVGDAIYHGHWYEAGVTEKKYLLIVMIRSQKPCKFTAYHFADINLGTFTRILSTSWSYFALLNQVYQD